MRKIVLGMLAVCICASAASAQSKDVERSAFKEAKRAALEEIRSMKRTARSVDPAPSAAAAAPSANLFDPESFDKQVVFLGALYAGTIFIDDLTGTGPFNSNGCPTDPMYGFGADDHCIQKTPNTTIPIQTIFDPAWEVTIPANTVKNVIYPMLNNTVSINSNGSVFTGSGGYTYVPVVTIASEAFNDSQAVIDGTPLNGSYTTTLAGAKFRSYGNPGSPQPFSADTDVYASIASRGISRDFWRALGLPNSVINNFYKKAITLKFGIRFQMRNSPDGANMFYTFRLLGQ